MSGSYTHSKPEALLEILGNDKPLFTELVRIFLEDSALKYKRLQIATQEKNAKNVWIESHSLKGMTGQVGAEELTRMLEVIELRSKKSDQVCSAEELATIYDNLKNTSQELQRFVAVIQSSE